jgi:hypothetical protein
MNGSTITSWQLTRVVAGSLLLLSLSLGAPASPIYQSANWLWFSAFIAANLMQSGLTRWCLMERLMRSLGLGAGE